MRYSLWTALAASAARLVAAEDLLFIDTHQAIEYSEATSVLGYTAKVVTETQWRAMTTDDFAQFKAIVLADQYCGSLSSIQFLDDTKAIASAFLRLGSKCIPVTQQVFVGTRFRRLG